MSNQHCVNTISGSCYYQLRNIVCIRKHNAINDVVDALVTSRLNYANVLIYGLPAKNNQCFVKCAKSCCSINNALVS